MAQLQPIKGTYVLLLHLPEATRFARVGPFGAVTLPEGFYVYVGSTHGTGGVRGRVRYHLRLDKESLHWHLDYVRPAMQPLEAWGTYDPVKRECAWARLMHQALGGEVIVPGFGAADDAKKRKAERCPAHFFHFGSFPSFNDFCRAAVAALPGHAPLDLSNAAALKSRQADALVPAAPRRPTPGRGTMDGGREAERGHHPLRNPA